MASSDRLPAGVLKVSPGPAPPAPSNHNPTGLAPQSCDVCPQMKKCAFANAARPSDERLTTVQFHRSAQVVMTAGLDRSISLFQVRTRTPV